MTDTFTLDTDQLGALPIVNAFCDRLGLSGLLEQFVPHDDVRVKLAPSAALGVVISNLAIGHRPVYALGEWAAGYEAALLGLSGGEVALLNDDRVGRELSRLFDADRASLLTRVVLDAIEVFDIDVSQLHNDSTSITFAGSHADADGHVRGGKPTPAIVHGHNKDHRPDLKQLVWILTVAADGAVPIAARTVDGNTTDDVTHIDTWDGLARLVGRTDFLYIADSKLATRTNMDHIHAAGGRFVSVLPATRKEDGQFRDWIVDHDPVWTEAARRPSRHNDGPDQVWHTTPAPWPSSEGHRIIWVRSTSKIVRDAETRRARIGRGIAALDDLNQRLSSPKSRIKTAVAAETAASAALAKAHAARWIGFTIATHDQESFRQEKRGRPGTNTRYRKIITTRLRVDWHVDEGQVGRDAASDGCFPLVSNDRTLDDAGLLAAYKYQPNLEKRYRQLKGTQLVTPMFLRDPSRIEALMCCHFLAMLVQALIERHIRAAMADRGLTELSLYPEDRGCAAPTTARILEIFASLARHHLRDTDQRHVQTFHPELTELQTQVLDLLDIPTSAYTPTS
ncbi:MAG TPA: IS1634 family transposase [Nocardioidaceae bacterium]|nr:IS1634 family transposase [Nocardioidaceae bacterium]